MIENADGDMIIYNIYDTEEFESNICQQHLRADIIIKTVLKSNRIFKRKTKCEIHGDTYSPKITWKKTHGLQQQRSQIEIVSTNYALCENMRKTVQSSTRKRTAESALLLSVLKVPQMEQEAPVVRNSNHIINN
ncbi:hypothetical protein BDC45DRAFT_530002 [Circinella umbellata]|nr:hypothetical protein BDC45DRAFT_530002 [Circinella umbellata]